MCNKNDKKLLFVPNVISKLNFVEEAILRIKHGIGQRSNKWKIKVLYLVRFQLQISNQIGPQNWTVSVGRVN